MSLIDELRDRNLSQERLSTNNFQGEELKKGEILQEDLEKSVNTLQKAFELGQIPIQDLLKAQKNISKLTKKRKLITRNGKTFLTTVYVNESGEETMSDIAHYAYETPESLRQIEHLHKGDQVKVTRKDGSTVEGTVSGLSGLSTGKIELAVRVEGEKWDKLINPETVKSVEKIGVKEEEISNTTFEQVKMKESKLPQDIKLDKRTFKAEKGQYTGMTYKDEQGNAYHSMPNESPEDFHKRVSEQAKNDFKHEAKKEEVTVKEKNIKVLKSKYEQLERDLAYVDKRIQEYRDKGWYLNSPKLESWKKNILRKVFNERERIEKNMNAVEYGHSIIKKIMKDAGVHQSTASSTAIRGFNNYSSGWDLEAAFNPDKVQLVGHDVRKAQVVVDKMREQGFEVEDLGESYKTLGGGSRIDIKFKKYVNLKNNA